MGEVGAPLGRGGAVEFGAEGVELGGGEVDAGMDAGEFGAQTRVQRLHLREQRRSLDLAVRIGRAQRLIGSLRGGREGEESGERKRSGSAICYR